MIIVDGSAHGSPHLDHQFQEEVGCRFRIHRLVVTVGDQVYKGEWVDADQIAHSYGYLASTEKLTQFPEIFLATVI